MAFAGSFSPGIPPMHATTRFGSAPLQLDGLRRKASCQSTWRPLLGPLQGQLEGSGPKQDAGCEFAPLLCTRRQQVIEAAERVTTAPKCFPLTAEDRVHDALNTMDALREAAMSAEALLVLLTAKEEEAAPDTAPSLPATSLVAAALSPEEPPQGLPLPEVPPPRSGSLGNSVVGWAAASVVNALLSIVPEVPPVPCVKGVVCVDGDLAALGFMPLPEILQAVLLSLVRPLARVLEISVFASSCPVSSNQAPDRDGGSGGRVDDAPRLNSATMRSFAYRILVLDRHDVEPLRETLLLESECGGARRLLPLLLERLCDENRSMPRHLKMRLEVQSGQ